MKTSKGYKRITIHTHIGYIGDFATEWWTKKDWREYRKEIKKLKKEGIFGKPITLTFMFKELKGFSDNGGDDLVDFKTLGFIIPDKP
jgi:hypothetical protein